jgi:hypothetical protein
MPLGLEQEKYKSLGIKCVLEGQVRSPTLNFKKGNQNKNATEKYFDE